MKDRIRTLTVPLLSGALLLGASAAMLNGCAAPARERPTALADINFQLQASTRDVLAGEIVTFTARTQNTLGRDVDINWRTTGGELTTERNGRIARVRFDSPGVYTVSSLLTVDDELVMADAVDVTVHPVR